MEENHFKYIIVDEDTIPTDHSEPLTRKPMYSIKGFEDMFPKWNVGKSYVNLSNISNYSNVGLRIPHTEVKGLEHVFEPNNIASLDDTKTVLKNGICIDHDENYLSLNKSGVPKEELNGVIENILNLTKTLAPLYYAAHRSEYK